jgi:hypothetical protein
MKTQIEILEERINNAWLSNNIELWNDLRITFGELTGVLPVRLLIKRSNNVWAWSNQFAGETIRAYKTKELGYENAYKVVYKENENLSKLHESLLTGLIHECDCEIWN